MDVVAELRVELLRQVLCVLFKGSSVSVFISFGHAGTNPGVMVSGKRLCPWQLIFSRPPFFHLNRTDLQVLRTCMQAKLPTLTSHNNILPTTTSYHNMFRSGGRAPSRNNACLPSHGYPRGPREVCQAGPAEGTEGKTLPDLRLLVCIAQLARPNQ